MRRIYFILLLGLFAFLPALAQEGDQEEEIIEEPIDERFTIDTPVTLDFEEEEEKEEPKKKKKKVKKKVFYGIKRGRDLHAKARETALRMSCSTF